MEVLVSHGQPFSETSMVYHHDNVRMVWEEMRQSMDKENAARFGELLEAAERERMEANGGVVLNVERWTFVARKPVA